MFFNQFIYVLRSYQITVGLKATIDFYKGLQLGLVQDLDDLYSLASLCFVKRVSQMDSFERAFIYFFCGVSLPSVGPGDPNLLYTKEYKKWLSNAILKSQLNPVMMNLSVNDLMEKFWNTIQEQLEEHHGGNKWVGTGGTSAFGHSGFSMGGVRVHGESSNRAANKVYANRRYISYSDQVQITDAPVARLLETMKLLEPHGPATELDTIETVYRSAKNAGEIELIFRRPLREKLEIILFLDNGGNSMAPFIDISRSLFGRIKNRFKYCDTYFFHNCIYQYIYKDDKRTRQYSLKNAMSIMNQPRVIIIGDAVMGPGELCSSYGAIDYLDECSQPGLFWLQYILKKSTKAVWLNPVPKKYWNAGGRAWTLQKIKNVFFMEDMSLGGLKNAIDYLSALH